MKRVRSLLKKLQPASFEDKRVASALLLNLLICVSVFFYIIARLRYLNPQIPFWYTKPWGDYQLAPFNFIFIIPVISLIFVIFTFFIVNRLHVLRNREAIFTTLTFLTISVSFLSISAVRIIQKGASPFPPVLNERISDLFPLVALSFGLCAFIVPFVIRFAKKYDIVTDPQLHSHPGMILKKPSARAGGLAFFIAFIAIALIFIPFNRETIGLYLGALLTTIVGVADDKKNINPYLRLLFLPLAIILTLVVSDLHIRYIATPFDGILRLDNIQFPITLGDFKFTFMPIADLFTVIWIMWVMNMLSWSNAVDGQFSGMTAITCFITSLLALRLLKIDPEQIHVARMGAIAAGASLGILPFNWHPSKIMWGFGATTMGLIIAMLSIMAGTKVAVATFVLIVPTLDALITILRRLAQKRSPVWGDRGHLHHRLLDMGFSPQQVSVFYWILTAFFGGIALISSGRSKFLALLTVGGIVSFILVAMNLKGELGKLKPPPLEK